MWKIRFPLIKEEPKDLYHDCTDTVHYLNAEHTNFLLAIFLAVIDMQVFPLLDQPTPAPSPAGYSAAAPQEEVSDGYCSL